LKSAFWLPLTALMLFSAFLLFQPRVAAGIPSFDAGGSGDVSLVVSFFSETDLVESGRGLPVVLTVTDNYGTPVEGAAVTLLADGGIVTPASGVTTLDGRFHFTYSSSASNERCLLIVATAHKAGTFGGVGRMVVVVTPSPGGGIGSIPVVPALSLAAILATIGGAGSTEAARYGMFKFLVFPLYSRIKKEDVLDHFVRGQIYGYIRANPGVHFNLLKASLRVNNGTLAHHLRTLEVQGFVKSRRDRMFKRFYAMDVSIPDDDGIRLSDLQAQILGLVSGGNGPTQTEIAEKLSVSQQAISYNLRMMSREGMISVERTGRERRYFAAEA
jgi:DNA-binding MarR family transcriptional regulator